MSHNSCCVILPHSMRSSEDEFSLPHFRCGQPASFLAWSARFQFHLDHNSVRFRRSEIRPLKGSIFSSACKMWKDVKRCEKMWKDVKGKGRNQEGSNAGMTSRPGPGWYWKPAQAKKEMLQSRCPTLAQKRIPAVSNDVQFYVLEILEKRSWLRDDITWYHMTRIITSRHMRPIMPRSTKSGFSEIFPLGLAER